MHRPSENVPRIYLDIFLHISACPRMKFFVYSTCFQVYFEIIPRVPTSSPQISPKRRGRASQLPGAACAVSEESAGDSGFSGLGMTRLWGKMKPPANGPLVLVHVSG